MDYTYRFEDHLREHRPSRLGQRVWWMPAAVGVVVVVADGIYLVATPSHQLSAALAVPLLFVAAFLFLLAWATLSIADWTYASERRYREAQHAAACQVRAYVLAGRRSGGGRSTAERKRASEPQQDAPALASAQAPRRRDASPARPRAVASK
jgi:hypothetical protein